MLTVYGASDDLIEIEGDISEEFQYLDSGDLLAFSDGTILDIEYRRGIWRIVPVYRGRAALLINPAVEGDDDHYSDRVTLNGVTVDWVVHGVEWAR